MNPDVCGVHVDEDGYIAQNADGAGRCSCSERVPLLRKGELEDLFESEGAALLVSYLGERFGAAAAQRLGPRGPRAGVELAAENSVVGVVDEPGGFSAAECFESGPM